MHIQMNQKMHEMQLSTKNDALNKDNHRLRAEVSRLESQLAEKPREIYVPKQVTVVDESQTHHIEELKKRVFDLQDKNSQLLQESKSHKQIDHIINEKKRLEKRVGELEHELMVERERIRDDNYLQNTMDKDLVASLQRDNRSKEMTIKDLLAKIVVLGKKNRDVQRQVSEAKTSIKMNTFDQEKHELEYRVNKLTNELKHAKNFQEENRKLKDQIEELEHTNQLHVESNSEVDIYKKRVEDLRRERDEYQRNNFELAQRVKTLNTKLVSQEKKTESSTPPKQETNLNTEVQGESKVVEHRTSSNQNTNTSFYPPRPVTVKRPSSVSRSVRLSAPRSHSGSRVVHHQHATPHRVRRHSYHNTAHCTYSQPKAIHSHRATHHDTHSHAHAYNSRPVEKVVSGHHQHQRVHHSHVQPQRYETYTSHTPREVHNHCTQLNDHHRVPRAHEVHSTPYHLNHHYQYETARPIASYMTRLADQPIVEEKIPYGIQSYHQHHDTGLHHSKGYDFGCNSVSSDITPLTRTVDSCYGRTTDPELDGFARMLKQYSDTDFYKGHTHGNYYV